MLKDQPSMILYVLKDHEASQEALRLVKAALGVQDFLSGHRSYNFNIFVDKDILVRKPLKEANN
ncbi:MAG: hypothetical protein AAB507_00015 [Patescibacteria group bacterium]